MPIGESLSLRPVASLSPREKLKLVGTNRIVEQLVRVKPHRGNHVPISRMDTLAGCVSNSRALSWLPRTMADTLSPNVVGVLDAVGEALVVLGVALEVNVGESVSEGDSDCVGVSEDDVERVNCPAHAPSLRTRLHFNPLRGLATESCTKTTVPTGAAKNANAAAGRASICFDIACAPSVVARTDGGAGVDGAGAWADFEVDVLSVTDLVDVGVSSVPDGNNDFVGTSNDVWLSCDIVNETLGVSDTSSECDTECVRPFELLMD